MPSALAFALFQQIHLFFEMLQGSYTRHGIEVAGCRPGFIPMPLTTQTFSTALECRQVLASTKTTARQIQLGLKVLW